MDSNIITSATEKKIILFLIREDIRNDRLFYQSFLHGVTDMKLGGHLSDLYVPLMGFPDNDEAEPAFLAINEFCRIARELPAKSFLCSLDLLAEIQYNILNKLKKEVQL